MKACAFTGSVSSLSLVLAVSIASCGGGAGDAGPAKTPAGDAPAEGPPSEAPAAAAGDEPGAAPAAGPTQANLGAGDSRTMDSIAALVKAHRKEARECYERALKQIPGLKGDVVIHFTLKPSGEMKHAELNEERSTIREASVTSCVIDVIQKIPFPRSSKGLESSVNYPFNFNP